jgi:hypothetical protein
MYNREQMKEALGKLSWKKVSELIEPVGFSNLEVFDRLIQDVVLTGCLIRKHATPEQRNARDKFRARLRIDRRYAAVSLPKVILSQFSRQDIQVYGKGEIFEAEVQRMFKEAKIPVAGLCSGPS